MTNLPFGTLGVIPEMVQYIAIIKLKGLQSIPNND